MTALERLVRTPIAALEFANTILTEPDAEIGTTPRDAVWTHRKTTPKPPWPISATSSNPALCSSAGRSGARPRCVACESTSAIAGHHPRSTR